MTSLKDSRTIQIGDVFGGSRQFTRQEVEVFCLVTRDRNPLHRDEEFARRAGFGRLIVPGLLVASIFGDVLSDWDLVATEVLLQFVKPVYVDDTVDISIEIVKKDGLHLSGSFSCENQGGNVVLQGTLKGMSVSRGRAGESTKIQAGRGRQYAGD